MHLKNEYKAEVRQITMRQMFINYNLIFKSYIYHLKINSKWLSG